MLLVYIYGEIERAVSVIKLLALPLIWSHVYFSDCKFVSYHSLHLVVLLLQGKMQ